MRRRLFLSKVKVSIQLCISIGFDLCLDYKLSSWNDIVVASSEGPKSENGKISVLFTMYTFFSYCLLFAYLSRFPLTKARAISSNSMIGMINNSMVSNIIFLFCLVVF